MNKLFKSDFKNLKKGEFSGIGDIRVENEEGEKELVKAGELLGYSEKKFVGGRTIKSVVEEIKKEGVNNSQLGKRKKIEEKFKNIAENK